MAALRAKKEADIANLKSQASKRMKQVYDLTDKLSAALTEKDELSHKLSTALTENRSWSRRWPRPLPRSMADRRPLFDTPTMLGQWKGHGAALISPGAD